MAFDFSLPSMTVVLAPAATDLRVATSTSSSFSSSLSPPTLKRPNGHRQYTAGELRAAVDTQIRSHGSVAHLSETSDVYDVPRTTLYDHVVARLQGRRVQRLGHPTVLCEDDELALAHWIDYNARVNLPLQLIDIRVAAGNLAIARHGPGRGFKTATGLPSPKWWPSFNKRRSQNGTGFVIRRAHHQHANKPTREQLVKWTNDLRLLIVEHGITEDRIYNVDETGLDGRYGRGAKLVVPKGTKEAHTVSPLWRGHFTIAICICANGTALPPHWIAQVRDPSQRKLPLLCWRTPLQVLASRRPKQDGWTTRRSAYGCSISSLNSR